MSYEFGIMNEERDHRGDTHTTGRGSNYYRYTGKWITEAHF